MALRHGQDPVCCVSCAKWGTLVELDSSALEDEVALDGRWEAKITPSLDIDFVDGVVVDDCAW